MNQDWKDESFTVREKSLRIIDQTALPPWSKGEMTMHRNVLVVWDEDRDLRVLQWIEAQSCEIVDELLVVSEHKGSLWLMWKLLVPEGYETDTSVGCPCGDVWTIHESRLG